VNPFQSSDFVDLGGARKRRGVPSEEVLSVEGLSFRIRDDLIVLSNNAGCTSMNFDDAASRKLFTFVDARVLEAVLRLLLPPSIMSTMWKITVNLKWSSLDCDD
jgi:hypothetical protein